MEEVSRYSSAWFPLLIYSLPGDLAGFWPKAILGLWWRCSFFRPWQCPFYSSSRVQNTLFTLIIVSANTKCLCSGFQVMESLWTTWSSESRTNLSVWVDAGSIWFAKTDSSGDVEWGWWSESTWQWWSWFSRIHHVPLLLCPSLALSDGGGTLFSTSETSCDWGPRCVLAWVVLTVLRGHYGHGH